MIIMLKWLSLLLLLGLIALPVSVAGSQPENIKVYRLLLPDGQVIAYTEFEPQVGDYYWQAETDKWYHVVRVEGDVGWLELTAPPEENGRKVTQHPLTWVTLVLCIMAVAYFWLVRRRTR